MLTDGQTNGRQKKVITIAHPKHSSGELKKCSPWEVDLFTEGTWYAGANVVSCKNDKKI